MLEGQRQFFKLFSTRVHTQHICNTHTSLKQQKHLISPTSSFVLCLLHRAEWKGVPVVNSMHRHTDSTSWLTLALFYMPAPGIPGSLSVSMVTEVASLHSVCTGSPRGPPRLSDDKALQNLHQRPPPSPPPPPPHQVCWHFALALSGIWCP
ncbi:hypothetical protein ACRRTK_002715 [Alexandromys fortis]